MPSDMPNLPGTINKRLWPIPELTQKKRIFNCKFITCANYIPDLIRCPLSRCRPPASTSPATELHDYPRLWFLVVSQDDLKVLTHLQFFCLQEQSGAHHETALLKQSLIYLEQRQGRENGPTTKEQSMRV